MKLLFCHNSRIYQDQFGLDSETLQLYLRTDMDMVHEPSHLSLAALPEALLSLICSHLDGPALQKLHNTCSAARHAVLQHLTAVKLQLPSEHISEAAKAKFRSTSAGSQHGHQLLQHADQHGDQSGMRVTLAGTADASSELKRVERMDPSYRGDEWSEEGDSETREEQQEADDTALQAFLAASAAATGSVHSCATELCLQVDSSCLIAYYLHRSHRMCACVSADSCVSLFPVQFCASELVSIWACLLTSSILSADIAPAQLCPSPVAVVCDKQQPQIPALRWLRVQ